MREPSELIGTPVPCGPYEPPPLEPRPALPLSTPVVEPHEMHVSELLAVT